MAATKISVHVKEVVAGEEFLLDHVDGGWVQIFDLDYRAMVGDGLPQFICAYAVVEPLSDKDAQALRDDPPPRFQPAGRYGGGESASEV